MVYLIIVVVVVVVVVVDAAGGVMVVCLFCFLFCFVLVFLCVFFFFVFVFFNWRVVSVFQINYLWPKKGKRMVLKGLRMECEVHKTRPRSEEPS